MSKMDANTCSAATNHKKQSIKYQFLLATANIWIALPLQHHQSSHSDIISTKLFFSHYLSTVSTLVDLVQATIRRHKVTDNSAA